MAEIVTSFCSSTIVRIAPNHLPGNQVARATWGQAHASQLFKVINVRSGVDIQTANVTEGAHQSTATGALAMLPLPVIWRDQRGDDVFLNHACIQPFAGTINPDQLVEALVFNESELSEDAARLIRFRFEFVDPALMPHSDRTDRAAWAHRLDDELSTKPVLERLVSRHWLARENAKRLSANDRAVILENTVSARIFNPSYRKGARTGPDKQENDVDTQTKEALALEHQAFPVDVINRRGKHFLQEFEKAFSNSRDLRAIVADLRARHVECGGEKEDDVKWYLATRDNFGEFKEALAYLCKYYEVSIDE